jgi:hypothetical protein
MLSHIWLGVWEENHRALKFYLKMVFLYLTNMFILGDDKQTDLLMKLEIKNHCIIELKDLKVLYLNP